MQVYIVEGTHPSVPGSPLSAHATKALADARALSLVNIIRAEPVYDPETACYDRVLPPLEPGAKWRKGLREWQCAVLAQDGDWLRDEGFGPDADDAEIADYLTGVDDDVLAEATEAGVTLTVLDVEGAVETLQPGAIAAAQGFEGKRYPHAPAQCPSGHWNDGNDVCADCGTVLS